MQSERFTLNKQDIQSWLKNALIFAGPAILVLLASAVKAVPVDYKYGAIILYVLNFVTDLLRKFLQGK